MPEPTFQEELNGVIYRYWNCPVKFIPVNVWGFLDVYDYYKQFPSAKAPDFDKVSKRFIVAYNYYEAKLNEGIAKALKER